MSIRWDMVTLRYKWILIIFVFMLHIQVTPMVDERGLYGWFRWRGGNGSGQATYPEGKEGREVNGMGSSAKISASSSSFMSESDRLRKLSSI